MSRAPPGEAGTVEYPLRLLATSDLHMSLLPYDYHADAPLPRPIAAPGLMGVADMLARLRGRGEEAGRAPPGATGRSLLFDCGDFLQGGPMADFLALEGGLADGAPHPMIAVMNLLGYDGVTLGNHDFAYGLGFIDRVLADARFPVVLSNVHHEAGRAAPVRPTRTLLSVALAPGLAPLRIGLIGLAPPQLVAWEEAHLERRLVSQGMAEAAVPEAAALRAEGADLVVALVHGGIAPPDAPDLPDHAALAVARVPGIDVLLLGHAHEVFPSARFTGWPGVDAAAGRLHGRPAVMPGMLGSHVGVVDLRLHLGDGGWQHRCVGVRAVPVATAMGGAGDALQDGRAAPSGPGAGLREVVMRAHEATRAHVARPVGRSAVRLHSHFAQIADGAALQLLAEAQRAWAATALRKRPPGAAPGAEGFGDPPGPFRAALDPARAGRRDTPAVRATEAGLRGAVPPFRPVPEGLRDPDLGPGGEPIFAAVAPLRAGGRSGPLAYTNVPAGPLLLRHVHDLYAFANRLRVLRLSAAMLVAWLERTAALFSRLSPERPDMPLLRPQAPAYAFDVIGGLDYTIDLGAEALFRPDGRRHPRAETHAPDATDPPPGRVRGLTFRGRPLPPDTPCLLVTSGFRARGGGAFPGTGEALDRPGGADLLDLRGDARAALLAHIRRAGTVGWPRPAAGWRLTAPPGSTALFDTAPAAESHLDEIDALRPEPLGLTPEGFLRLRLHF